MHKNTIDPATVANARLPALVLGLCFLFNFLARGIGDTFMVFLLPLQAEFGWQRSQMTGVYSALMVISGLSSPLAGLLIERWGPRKLYSVGIAVLAGGYFLAGFATEIWHFYVCVGLLGGLGAGAIGMVPATALLSRWFSHRLGAATGIAYAGFGCGSLVMVPLTQAMIDASGWRAAYRWAGEGLLVALVLSQLIPWRAILVGRADPLSPKLARGAAGSRSASAALRSALGQRRFWLMVQIMFFTAVGMYLVIVQSVAYLVDVGFPPLKAASAFGVAGMLSVVGVSSVGWIADRFGYKRSVTASFIGTASGVAMLYSLSFGPSTVLLACYVLLFGIFQGVRGPLIASLSSRLFAGPGQAAIYGVIYACMAIGSGIGALLSGVLFDATGSYRPAFMLSFACLTLAAAPFWTSDLLRHNRVADNSHPSRDTP
ncbi:MAG: MFS transporter [Burkholderiaceae bacterium]|nr:MFS transporter [Burkholderiaceae bacterium]